MAIVDAFTRFLEMLHHVNPADHVNTVVASVSIPVLFVLVQWTLNTLRPRNFPPGPPVTPGLGNLLQMPMAKPYLTFEKWFKEHGDLVGLKIGTDNMVIINKPEIVNELFDKRGAFYSARPINHILTKHVFPHEEDKQIAILQYDDYYRRWRKCFNYILSTAGVKRIQPILEAEAANFSRLCLDGGKNHVRNLYYWAIAGPVAVTCGKRMDDLPPDYIETFVKTQDVLLELIVPGAAPPVDVFPFLKYIPSWLGASWKTRAKEARHLHSEDRNMYLRYGKEQREQLKTDPATVGLPSLLAKILGDQEANPSAPAFTDIELSHIGCSISGAAVDTTAATLKSLLLMFACHPEAQKKAQREIDQVGGGRPPQAAQLDQLVYVRACISEAIRFRPTTPSALPHTLEKDDWYNGYFFPKGTTFIANAWSLNHNPEDFDHPDEWIPERFLDNPYGLKPERYAELLQSSGAKPTAVHKDATVDTPSSQPAALSGRRALYAFGSGRRMCPGIDFAFTSLLLATAKTLWAHNVLPPTEGVDFSIETGYMDGLVTSPKNPQVFFKLRDDSRKAGLMNDVEKLQAIASQLVPE